MENILGFMIFVSYNRNKYIECGVDIDCMTMEEFRHFYWEDEVRCLSVETTTIYDTTQLCSSKSEAFDDSVCWFVSKEFVDSNDRIRDFITSTY